MGFSRVLFNIASFGAVSRVEKAGNDYQRLVYIYNRMVDEIQEVKNDINKFSSEEKVWKSFKKENKRILDILKKDTKLTSQSKNALQILRRNSLNTLPNFKNSISSTFCDSTIYNISGVMGTLIMNIVPFFGVIGIHCAANEDIERFRELSDSAQIEINKIKPIWERVMTIGNELKIRREAIKHIMELVEQYKSTKI